MGMGSWPIMNWTSSLSAWDKKIRSINGVPPGWRVVLCMNKSFRRCYIDICSTQINCLSNWAIYTSSVLLGERANCCVLHQQQVGNQGVGLSAPAAYCVIVALSEALT